ncbi:MAG: zinc-ribbon domain-containing protein [Syntrophaceae bacterium]|nr:zinc-ribbon domain-containing protein [Syntrophaceae bacterium]
MQQKFCANCGQPLEPNSRFCGECGEAIESAVFEEKNEISEQQVESTEKKPTSEKKQFKWRGTIIAVVIVIIGIGLGTTAYFTHLFGLLPGKQELIPENIPEVAPSEIFPAPGAQTVPAFQLSSISKYVTSVRFFESDYTVPPKPQRIYKRDFSTYKTRYINWELNLKFPAVKKRTDFGIHAVWYRPDGSVHFKETMKAYVDSGWKNSWHVSGLGNKVPGSWRPGRYKIVFSVDNRKIASGTFTIH